MTGPPEPFVGRQWLLDIVAGWAAGSSGLLAITGPPGTGKSRVARHLVDEALNARVAAVHVCQADRDASRDPVRFVMAVSGQLADRIPGFRAARERVLAESSGAAVSVVGSAQAGVVGAGGMNVGALVTLPAWSALELVDRLIRQPLQEVASSSAAPIVLVDALDESLGFAASTSLPAVIVSLADGTPVRWLVTTRRDPRILPALDELVRHRAGRVVDLIDDCPRGVDDLATYVARRLDGAGTTGTARLVHRINAQAAGNFLYARYVVDDLLAHPAQLAAALADRRTIPLPRDLADAYRQFLNRELRRTDTPEGEARWHELYRPVLERLAVAYDPGLTANELATLMRGGQPVAAVRRALTLCAQLLTTSAADRDGRWRIYHQSFREHLLLGEDRIGVPAEAHAATADALTAEWAASWDECDDYALAHTVAHHLAALADPELPRRDHRRLLDQLGEVLADPVYQEVKLFRLGLSPLLLELAAARTALGARAADRRVMNTVPAVDTLIRQRAHLVAAFAESRDRVGLHQELHNAAVSLGRTEMAAAYARRLDQLGAASLRLAWRGGGDPRLRAVLTGHTNAVLTLLTLSDGRLASGSTDGTVRLWDPDRRAEDVVLTGATSSVAVLIELPDGRIAAASGNRVYVWDPALMGDPVAWIASYDSVSALAALPDGDLACLCAHGDLTRWRLTGDPEQVARPGALYPPRVRVRRHDFTVDALLVTRERIAAASPQGFVRVWTPANGAEPVFVSVDSLYVNSLDVLPDGRIAAGGGRNVLVWDPADPDDALRLTLRDGLVNVVAALPDGRVAVASGERLHLWDLRDGVTRLRQDAHTDLITTVTVLRDGRLATGSVDNSIRVWNVNNGGPPLVLIGHTDSVRAIVELPGGRIASAANDDTVRIWDIAPASGERRSGGHTERVTALAALPGGVLVSAAAESDLRVWTPDGDGVLLRTGHRRQVNALAVLTDGTIASGSQDGTIQISDPSGERAPVLLTTHTRSVNALATMPDGRLVSGASNGTVRIWDAPKGTGSRPLVGHRGRVTHLLPLRGGRLVTASVEEVSLWNPAEEQARVALDGTGPLLELPDGRLVRCRGDGTIVVSDLSGNGSPVTLTGGSARVTALASLGGGRLASGYGDGVVRIWRPTAGTAPTHLLQHDAPILALAQLADGLMLSADRGQVAVWEVREDSVNLQALLHAEEITALAVVGPTRLAIGDSRGWVGSYDVRDTTLGSG